MAHDFLGSGEGMENSEDFWGKAQVSLVLVRTPQTSGNCTASRTLHRFYLEGCPGLGASSCKGRLTSKPLLQNVSAQKQAINVPISLSVSGLPYLGRLVDAPPAPGRAGPASAQTLPYAWANSHWAQSLSSYQFISFHILLSQLV